MLEVKGLRRTLYFAGCLILIGAAWLLWAVIRDRQLAKGFDEIEVGTTEQEVLRLMGQPKRVEKCGEFWGPFEEEELRGCTKEYYYASPFAPLLPQYFVIRFDRNNRVQTTIPLTSP